MFQFIRTIYENFNFLISMFFISVIIILLLLNKKKAALAIVGATFFYKNLTFQLVSNMEIWKISVALLLISLPKTKKKAIKSINHISKPINALLIYIIYIVLTSSVFTLILPFTNISTYSSFSDNEGRIITQLVYYFLIFMLFFSPLISLSKIEDLIYVIRWIIIGILVLATFGVLQKISFMTTGLNLFPINRAGILDETDATLNNAFVSNITRINSLAGEPKHFSISLVIGIGMIMYGVNHSLIFIRWWPLWIITMLILLYFTYSTTGFVLLIIFIFIFIFRMRIKRIPLIGVSCLFIILIGYWLIQSESDAIYFVMQKTGLEIQDESIQEAIINNPLIFLIGVGAGNIHHFSIDYLPDDFGLFRDKAYKANSGLLFVLADAGLFGYLALTFCVYWLIRYIKIYCKKYILTNLEHRLLLYLSDITIMTFIVFNFRYTELFFLVMGLTSSAIVLVAQNHCKSNP